MTRILATIVRDEERNNKGHRKTDSLGNRRSREPLAKDQCAFCREKGHWVKNCPKKWGTTKKILTLEEEN